MREATLDDDNDSRSAQVSPFIDFLMRGALSTNKEVYQTARLVVLSRDRQTRSSEAMSGEAHLAKD